ncbi:MAG: hypothetical protein NTY53_10145 [Kiritimatiellaeota bacterium]|nr:hypothetical protein [Kiritimatiellota bacterium]
MNIWLDDITLFGRAVMRLNRPRDLAPNLETLFDPAIPLPLPMPLPDGFPSFSDLFDTIPEPYASQVFHAHAQIGGLAATAWPAMCGLVDAQPFFEWLMHTDVFQPWYRDHLVHQVRVAAIGDLLLDARVDGHTLLDHAVAALRPRLRRRGFPVVTAYPEQFVRLAWWLTGLFHDCMYPYQHHQEHYKKIGGVCQLPLANPTQTSWFATHSSLAGLVGSLSREDLLRCEEAHHQFAGAAELAMQNEIYENTIGRREGATYRHRRRTLFALAAEAILSHHKLRNLNRRIRFRESPLGFLLVLSDELHETDRPRAQTYTQTSPDPAAITEFIPGEVSSVRVTANNTVPRHLRLRFCIRPGTTQIRGRPTAIWERAKNDTLTDMLKFGVGEIFETVSVRAR